METMSAQVVIGYLAVWLIQQLKASDKVPWLVEGAAIANRVAAGIAAAAALVGISYQYDTAAGTLFISGLSVASVAAALIEFGRGWIAQKLVYLWVFKRAPVVT